MVWYDDRKAMEPSRLLTRRAPALAGSFAHLAHPNSTEGMRYTGAYTCPKQTPDTRHQTV
jgi:hypothetical protein